MESVFWRDFVEFVFATGLFVNAMLFVPQAWEIYRAKSAHGQSLLAFAGFNVIQLFTALHAALHEDHILMIGASLSLVTCGMVTFAIVIYKSKMSKM